MAAEVEEALIEPHGLDAEQLAPEGGDLPLAAGARRGGRFLVGVLGGGRRRERRAIDLAAGAQRQRREDDDGGGNHGGGELAAQERPELGDLERRTAARHDVGGEAGAAGEVGAHLDDRLAHRRVRGERRLDLPQLDADAADLDLAVDAADELDGAVGPVARQVAGAIKAGAQPAVPIAAGPAPSSRSARSVQVRAPWVRDERLRREIGPPEVAAGQADAADQELSRHPCRHRPQAAVDQVDLGAADRPPDRQGAPALARLAAPGGHGDRRLGRPVAVVELGGGDGVEPLRQLRRHRLAAGHHVAQRPRPRQRLLLDQHREDRGGEVGVSDPLLLDQLQEIGGVELATGLGEHHRAADEERPEELEHRDVEADGRLLQHPAAVPQVGRGVVLQAVADGAMGDDHPLRPPGRAGGEEQVGGMIGEEPALRRPLVLRLRLDPGAGEGDLRHAGRRERRGEAGLDEERPRRRVLEHRGEPLGGQAGIERQVGAARLPDGEEAHHHLERALGRDGDDRLRPDAEIAQPAGEPVGAAVEGPVGERLAGEDHRRRPRQPQGGGMGDLVQELERRVVDPRGVPFGDELPALGRGEERQLGEPPLGVPACLPASSDRRQEDPEVTHQAGGGRAVEELGAVDQAAGQPVRLLAPGEREVELRRLLSELDRRQRQAGQAERLGRSALQRDHHLEDRRVAGVAHRLQRLDQAPERQILVRIGADGHLAHPRQQAAKRGIAAEVEPQRQGVDEEADQPLRLAAGAVGDRRAQHHVVLPGVTAEQGGEGADEDHEEGGPLALGEGAERGAQRARQAHDALAAADAAHPRPRVVERQVEHRGAGQALAPVGELAALRRAGHPPPLPGGEVGVLERRLGEGRRPAGGRRGVEGAELAHHDPHRPAVRDDVMHRHQQQVLGLRAGGEPHERRAQQRAGGEVEGPRHLLPPEGLGGGGARRRRQGREVDLRQRHRRRGRHRLQRPAIVGAEGRPQHLVAAGDGGERGGEGRGVEAAGEPHGDRQVVDRGARRQAIEEPEPLLGEGERQRHGSGALDGDQGWRGRRRPLAPRRLHPLGQAGDGGALEEGAQRQLGPHRLAQARHQARGEDRVAAEGEEVVVHADPRHAEDLLPERRQPRLVEVARRLVGPGAPLGLRQAAAVELAVRGQRQRREDDEGGGDHVVRQPRGEMRRAAPGRAPRGPPPRPAARRRRPAGRRAPPPPTPPPRGARRGPPRPRPARRGSRGS